MLRRTQHIGKEREDGNYRFNVIWLRIVKSQSWDEWKENPGLEISGPKGLHCCSWINTFESENREGVSRV